MTYTTSTSYGFTSANRRPSIRETSPHAVSGAVALTLSMVVGAWILFAHSTTMVGPPVDDTPLNPPPIIAAHVVYKASSAPTQTASLVVRPTQQNAPAVSNSGGYVAWLDPTVSLNDASGSFADNPPLATNFQLPATDQDAVPVPTPKPAALAEADQNVPLPAPRPPEFALLGNHGASRALARQEADEDAKPTVHPAAPQSRTVLASTPPEDHRSFFDKIFGTRQPSGPVLAYAAPEDGAVPGLRSAPMSTGGDGGTAVYDISAHTVYLPDGTRLEAHSGLGSMLDDPRYVREKMRGATPPSVYDLQLREELFHGVRALRLIPVNGEVYGRTGLLAHTFMLGPNGDSNGCVSFRNYNAFLQAYLSGKIRRLNVVAHL